jgi:hypothetical protein
MLSLRHRLRRPFAPRATTQQALRKDQAWTSGATFCPVQTGDPREGALMERRTSFCSVNPPRSCRPLFMTILLLRSNKALMFLAERHRGRTYLLNQLAKKGSKRPPQDCLAMGYQALELREDGDEGVSAIPFPHHARLGRGESRLTNADSVPPLSIFYPPSSQRELLELIPSSLPPQALPVSIHGIAFRAGF